jgi:cellulose synthase/poly-beta-1,6-N-acetylglucosamine synthase-like glycosyltransferase
MIAPCLHQLVRASEACGPRASVWIVVVADSCTDQTAEHARQALGHRGTVLECALGSVGAARRLGVSSALRHFRQRDLARIWLANTDADTWVPDDWLQRQLDFADAGVAALAGVVSIESVPGFPQHIADLLLKDYEIAADGSHAHVHGANLGVRADAYLDVGGWSKRELAEDHCLWARLRQGGWTTRASASSVVVTSGRLSGRARGGFADTLHRKLALLLDQA